MKLYFTEHSITEFENLPPFERKAILRAFSRRPFFWLTIRGAIACLFSLAAILNPFVPGQPVKWNTTWLMAAVSALIWLSWAQLVFARLHGHVRKYLRAPRLLLGEPAIHDLQDLGKRQRIRLFALHAAWSDALESIHRSHSEQQYDLSNRLRELICDFDRRLLNVLGQSQADAFACWRQRQRAAVNSVHRLGGESFDRLERNESCEAIRDLRRSSLIDEPAFAVIAANISTAEDDALASLEPLTLLESLTIVSSQVTDAGLQYLSRLSNLQQLNLRGTSVTAAGVAELQKAVPNCNIIH